MMAKPVFLRKALVIALLLCSSLALAQDAETGRIIVDLWTEPADDSYSFNFDASGGDYADFTLTHSAPPNEQELAPGIYSIFGLLPPNWSIDSFDCTSSSGNFEDSGNIELEAGETVNCFFSYIKEPMPLGISMELGTSWIQNYYWAIDKVVTSPAVVTASAGETVHFDYEITVSQRLEYNDYRAFGTVYVSNSSPEPRSFRISGLLGGTLSVPVTCYDIFGAPTTVVQGQYTNECLFSLSNLEESVHEGQELVISVTTTDAPPHASSHVMGVLEWNSDPIPVVLPQQIEVVDDAQEPFFDSRWPSISSNASFLNQQSYTCPTDSSLYVNGQYSISLSNTASILETGASDTVSVTINCSAPVVSEQCVYGQGYWRNHSEQGNAPYDDAWSLISPAGANTGFFLSGTSYYEVMSTAPAGNVYYQLARQYIAAKLNILNGVISNPDLDAAIVWAESQFFNLYTPSNVPNNLREIARSYSDTLASFNDGAAGVVSCGE